MSGIASHGVIIAPSTLDGNTTRSNAPSHRRGAPFDCPAELAWLSRDVKARADLDQPEPKGRSVVTQPEGLSTRLRIDGEQTWAASGSLETAT
jgi:hypothetical protein